MSTVLANAHSTDTRDTDTPEATADEDERNEATQNDCSSSIFGGDAANTLHRMRGTVGVIHSGTPYMNTLPAMATSLV